MGIVALKNGKTGEALPLLERAHKISAEGKVGGVALANRQFLLAKALWRAGGDKERALTLAKEAGKTYAEKGTTKEGLEVDAWLKKHGGH